jgi:phosphatidylserine/phosphatidylglycerophosphate/cardiolipin synthase-like enzyme
MEDLSFFLGSSIKEAKNSLFASSFGIDDPLIIRLIENQASLGKKVEVAFDANQIHSLNQITGITLTPFQEKSRLMHRKVIALDEDLLLFGSTNLTTSSLKLHRNQCVAIRSKELYESLKKEQRLDHPKFSFYPIPKEGKSAFKRLLKAIHGAKKEILIAMYTFTEEEILDALIAASNRGVNVRLYIDRGMARGVCKKLIKRCLKTKIHTAESRGDGYLHYKCALIDESYVFGSTNWTKSGFFKNLEYLLFINELDKQELSYLKKFFHQLKITCKELKKPAIDK